MISFWQFLHILLYFVDKKKFYGAMELKEEAVRVCGMGVPCDGNS